MQTRLFIQDSDEDMRAEALRQLNSALARGVPGFMRKLHPSSYLAAAHKPE